MFATFAGGYSRKPLPAQPDRLGQAEADLRAGRIDEAAYREVADAFVREVLDEMAVVALGIVGDGGVRAADRTLRWIGGLQGLQAGARVAVRGGEVVFRPVATGAIRWHEPVLVRDWTFAGEASELIVKQTMLGPYTLASLAEPSDRTRRATLATAFGEAQAEELRALSTAGCAMIEIDEPSATRIGDDAAEWAVFRAAQERLMAGHQASGAAHLSLGLWGGAIDAAGHAALIEQPYLSYLVDVLAGPSAWRFIDAVPADRGIIAGAGDATTAQLAETEVLVWARAWAAQGGRGSGRVGVAPNGSLAAIDRHFAHRKCLRLGEAVRIARMGPLQGVAEALDETPSQSRMPELRSMAAAVQDARGS
jgi:methionine synthase II (cobalamin-independent)